jgi:hypothetical protein
MIPVIAGPKFQVVAEPISNHDRCNVCGSPRSVHGFDWSCPPGIAPGRRFFAPFVCLTGLLILGGIAWLTATSAASTTAGTLAASGFLAGLTLLVCGLCLVSRRP